MKLALLSMQEDEEVAVGQLVAELDQADALSGVFSDLDSLHQSAAEIDQVQRSIDEGFETTRTFDAMESKLKEAEFTGGVSPAGADAVIVAVEHMRARLGFVRPLKVASEQHSGPVDRKKALSIAREGIMSSLQSIWQAIIDAIKRIGEWFKGFFNYLFGTKSKQDRQVAVATTMCEQAVKAEAATSPEVKKIVEQLEVSDDISFLKLTPEQVKCYKEQQIKCESSIKKLTLGEFPYLSYMGKPLSNPAEYKILLMAYQEEVLKNYATLTKKANVDATLGVIASVLENVDQIEPRHLALSNFDFLNFPDHLGPKAVRKDLENGLEQRVGVNHLGDYAIVTISAKDSKNLAAVEERLDRYSFKFTKLPGVRELASDEKMKPVPLADAKELLKELDKCRKAIAQDDVVYMREQYVALIEKVSGIGKDAPGGKLDASVVKVAFSVVNAFKNTYIDYIATSESYLVGFTNDMTRYLGACAKLKMVTIAVAEEVVKAGSSK